MINIVPQCKEINCYLDGKILLGHIKECNVPDLEILKINSNAHFELNVELKARSDKPPGLHAAFGKQNLQLEIQASIENNYGKTVRASWKFRGLVGKVSGLPLLTEMLTLNANFYEHIIDDQEIFHIDVIKKIRRVDGVDQLEQYRF